MARSEGLEPPTYKFVACCSIQLSYDRVSVEATTVDTGPLFYSLQDSEREGFEPSIRLDIV
jgi:hypothetical protein